MAPQAVGPWQALDEFLVYGQTTTSIIQSSPVPVRPLPLPNGAAPR